MIGQKFFSGLAVAASAQRVDLYRFTHIVSSCLLKLFCGLAIYH